MANLGRGRGGSQERAAKMSQGGGRAGQTLHLMTENHTDLRTSLGDTHTRAPICGFQTLQILREPEGSF